MNSEQLAQALKITPIKAEEWIDAINETFERFDIDRKSTRLNSSH